MQYDLILMSAIFGLVFLHVLCRWCPDDMKFDLIVQPLNGISNATLMSTVSPEDKQPSKDICNVKRLIHSQRIVRMSGQY